MTNFCTNCGHNMSADDEILLDGWRLVPGMVWHGLVPVKVTGAMADILHTLAEHAPRPVRHEALANRASRGRYSTASLKVTICKLRQILGALSPIETVVGFGYRWSVPTVEYSGH